MADLYRIEFESVGAIEFPELYDWRTERARQDIDRDSLHPGYWHKVSRDDNEASIRSQYQGLQQLIGEGELIRNVRVFRLAVEVVEVMDVTPECGSEWTP